MSIPTIQITESSDKSSSERRLCDNCLDANNRCLSIFNRNGDLVVSDVSDDESFFEVYDFNEEFINDLKVKIKNLREKVRDKNKTIRNQNVDLDNFLEDIKNKDKIIENFEIQIKQQSVKTDKSCQVTWNSIELDAPDSSIESSSVFKEFIETQSTIASLPFSNDISTTGEYYLLPEASFEELKDLKNHVENLRQVSLHDVLNDSNEFDTKINHACHIISKVQSNLLKHDRINKNRIKNNEESDSVSESLKSDSESSVTSNLENNIKREMFNNRILTTPQILNSPGKTVQQIRHDNEKLINFNTELKDINHDLKTDIDQYTILSENQSKVILILKNQIEQLEFTILKTKNEKDEELIKAVDNKERELRDLYFKNKQDELHESNEYSIERDEVMMCKDPIKLLERIERINDKIKTAERQIDKDWTIIEGQGAQLENLHNQYIGLRDENRKNEQLVFNANRELSGKEDKLKEIETVLGKKCEEVEKLNGDINRIKHNSKVKEEELQSILLEKEEGIEKLHSMISELEKSLNNSQTHIEGIVKESLENRERENETLETIKIQERDIKKLKAELISLKKQTTGNYKNETLDFSKHETFIQLQQEIQGVKMNYQLLKVNINKLINEFNNEFEKNCIEFRNTPIINDVHSVRSLQTTSINPEMQNKIYNLEQTIITLQSELQRKDDMHQIQVDTVIKSLANRSKILPRSKGKKLAPSIEMNKSSKSLSANEFLQTCVKELTDVNTTDSEIKTTTKSD